MSVVTVTDLRVTVGRALVDGVSFEVGAGEVLAIVGASGSGKTTTGLALLGEYPAGAEVSGEVKVRGRAGFVPQHPGAVLNPVRRVGSVLRELASVSAVEQAVDAARFPRSLLDRYPHQLSGGQQQRLVLAQALLGSPAVVVADEPTTGLDRETRDEVVGEFGRLAQRGVALVVLSHDMDVVRALADHVVVLRAGKLMESGPAAEVLTNPRNPYTRALLVDPIRAAADDATGSERLRVENLVAHHGKATALHGIDLRVSTGECLAVMGPSGSGKTTLARCVVGLHPPTSGTITLDGRPLARTLRSRPRHDLAAIQYVFQDARASFDHRRPVLDQVARTAVLLRGMSTQDSRAAALSVLASFRLDEATARRLPPTLSGGELHRAALARAVLASPEVLVCDEITTGLDTVTRQSVLAQLTALRDAQALTLILITHDHTVATHLADRVMTLHEGRLRTP
ncbi:peptide/nickel transport system ATP-binding protein [Actinokineospora baliensis]|uniref:ABC transporter ATP-binding protein n=1 Tax=Actinokineospora baliensis TaxID=547056 RepID=UPI00195EC29F|nr:ATP-binding cassette domain-containing protein [Actinokineospora baliensis]MBM7775314.1 peptide/nickel transport system ATP-binding protein [Actinokineospora baliensis]